MTMACEIERYSDERKSFEPENRVKWFDVAMNVGRRSAALGGGFSDENQLDWYFLREEKS